MYNKKKTHELSVKTYIQGLLFVLALFMNDGSGIFGFSGCNVDDNTARDNMEFGLELTLNDTYRNNVLTRNNANGAQVSGGINISGNSCGGTNTCP